jgi:hypothetical protein
MILKIFVVALITAITIASGDDKIPTNRAVNSPIVVLKFWKKNTGKLTVILFYKIKKVPATSSVIIIGAGASGIAAATRLVQKGYSLSQITILEAQNRIGGRVNTVSYGEKSQFFLNRQ